MGCSKPIATVAGGPKQRRLLPFLLQFLRAEAGISGREAGTDARPTGHTLLLLDATGAYDREMLRTTAGAAGKVQTPLMHLRDPDYTRVLLVTLAETTPVLEAAELRSDLRRAGVEPFAWMVNTSPAAAGRGIRCWPPEPRPSSSRSRL